ncbi:MAG: prepilin-type N-terminal cleavage/methylation domain-containing protein [Patescibacteria group bacterium]
MRKFFLHRRAAGFTIIELMIALTILTMLALFGGRIYLNYMSASRDLKAGNLVYEEARFLMEKIVREVRQSGIDYEQYFNQNVMIPYNLATFGETGSYGDNYCVYSSFFYDNDNESIGSRNTDMEASIVAAPLNPAAVRAIENDLYLINLAGNRRTMIKRIERNVDGDLIGKISMVKMEGRDFGEDHINRNDSYNGAAASEAGCLATKSDTREADGLTDTWLCAPDYPCTRNTPLDDDIYGVNCFGFADTVDDDHGFVDISPNALNVVNLQFIVSPKDDPWKAYNMDDAQIQPYVTIQMTVEANPKLVDTTNEARVPSITLTSTITTRNYNEINSDCR